MDRATLRKVSHWLGEAEMAVSRMINSVDPKAPDPDMEMDEFIQEMYQVEGALMEFDRYLASFSLPNLDK